MIKRIAKFVDKSLETEFDNIIQGINAIINENTTVETKNKIVTDNYTINPKDKLLLIDCTTKDILINLPQIKAFKNDILIIKKIDSTIYNATIIPYGNEKIFDNTEVTEIVVSGSGSVYQLTTDNNTWYVI